MTTVYGLVNQGVQSLITEKFGAEDWADICRRAGLTEREFDCMRTYPDDVTHRLVTVISEKYEMEPAKVLQVFGDYWVDFSKATDIGILLRFGGETLAERLETLNEMHARIKMSMPHLNPPTFEFEACDDGTYKLHYASAREGLESMVIGLVEGLGRETGEAVSVTQDPEPAFPEFRATFTLRVAAD